MYGYLFIYCYIRSEGFYGRERVLKHALDEGRMKGNEGIKIRNGEEIEKKIFHRGTTIYEIKRSAL